MKLFKRTIFLVFIIAVIIAIGVNGHVVFAASKIEEKKTELNKINLKLKENSKKLEEAKLKEKSLLNQVQDTDQRIDVLEKNLNELNKQLTDVSSQKEQTVDELGSLKQQLLDTNIKLEIAEKELEDQLEVLNDRAKNIYKNGRATYLEVLLNSKDFSDFLNRLSYLKFIFEQDVNVLQKLAEIKANIELRKREIEENKTKVEEKKKVLEVQESKIQSITDVVESNKRNTEAEKGKKLSLLEQVQEDKESYIKAEKELLQASRDISSMIKNLSRGRSRTTSISGTGRFIWPTEGEITSDFGLRIHPIFKVQIFHAGLDIGAPTGRKIAAADSGEIIYTGSKGGYGNTVIISHGGDLSTLYAHTSKILVSEGQTVSKGDIIALVGSTGYSTGPHLHFEVRVDGEPKDPLGWLK